MILVTGATGNIGRRLVAELDARGERQRILVRDPARASNLPPAAERAVGDLSRAESLPSAFAGIERLFLLTQGIGTDLADHAITAARRSGVRQIVLISSYSAGLEPPPAMARWHRAREQAVAASGVPATFLRPGGFMTNALEWAPTIRSGGYVVDPTGPGRLAPIDPDDIAAVAAVVLTTLGHQGKAYTLTVEEALTVAEQVAILAEALGRTIATREASSAEEAVAARFPNGAPPALADALLEGYRQMRADTVGLRTDVVERLLGRKPALFADWCRRHAQAFR